MPPKIKRIETRNPINDYMKPNTQIPNNLLKYNMIFASSVHSRNSTETLSSNKAKTSLDLMHEYGKRVIYNLAYKAHPSDRDKKRISSERKQREKKHNKNKFFFVFFFFFFPLYYRYFRCTNLKVLDR